MISSEEALAIFRKWLASGSTIKLISLRPTGEGGTVLIGRLDEVGEDAIIFTSLGNDTLHIPLEGTTFRKVPREQVIHSSSTTNWDESLELRWTESGNFLLFLRLVPKLSTAPKGID
jgi:hypothetical protein